MIGVARLDAPPRLRLCYLEKREDLHGTHQPYSHKCLCACNEILKNKAIFLMCTSWRSPGFRRRHYTYSKRKGNNQVFPFLDNRTFTVGPSTLLGSTTGISSGYKTLTDFWTALVWYNWLWSEESEDPTVKVLCRREGVVASTMVAVERSSIS